jgi:WNK lysine deficient protein kinase
MSNQQQIPSPAELSQQQQQNINKASQPQTMDSGIASTPQSASSTASSTSTMKKRRAAKSSERYPKLVVLRLLEEKIVECEMEVKPKTVTFKFDVHEVNPDEVAKDLVRKIYFKNL